MIRLIAALLLFASSLPASASGHGLVAMQSPHDVATTADRLENALEAKGMTIFARIDHAKGAQSAGLELAPTEQVIFGNPKVGTPVMQCERTAAIDLPQKMIVWEDESGQTWIAYNDPAYVKTRHDVSGCDEVFERIAGALANFASAAIAE